MTLLEFESAITELFGLPETTTTKINISIEAGKSPSIAVTFDLLGGEGSKNTELFELIDGFFTTRKAEDFKDVIERTTVNAMREAIDLIGQ
jgi:hypothetical protein